MWLKREMKFALGFAVVAAFAAAGDKSYAQAPDPHGAPNPYRLDDGWAKLPDGRSWGGTFGISVDRDGHGGDTNARIVKFTKDGKFIKTWGTKGTAPGQFDTPHMLAMDSAGRLFVADRVNNRIQIFDQEGQFLDEWKQFGRPSGVYIN